jgi:hydrogenase maturation factor HypE
MIFQVGDKVISTRGNGKGTILHPAAPGLWQVQWESGSILTIREVDMIKKSNSLPITYNIKKVKKPIHSVD